MASPVEKYELILSADPRSRIFVELGRALIERGDHPRAVEVLRGGLVHHTDSVQARVLLGRALLSMQRPAEAVDPLAQALALTPGDPRIQLLLDQAMASARAAEPPEMVELVEAEAAPVAAGGPLATPLPAALDLALLGADAPERREPTGSIPLDAPPSAAPPRAPPSPEAPATPPPPIPAPALASGTPPAPPPLPPAEAGPLRHLPRMERKEEKGKEAISIGLPPDPAEAARIAAEYERQLRDKMSVAQEAPERSRRPGFLLALVALLVVGSIVTYALVRRALRTEEARSAVTAARAGLARDTLGSLREAARVLEEARALDPSVADVTSLQAQVAALLWTDFADEKALERARALASSPAAGEGALVARYLTAPGAAERDQAAEALLSGAQGSGPLLRILAAGVLRGRGDRDGARHHLEAAARAQPPMLRALAELGDMLRAAGDLEEALRFYRSALQAHATHPRSVLGAAEARLALGKGLEDSLREITALDADERSQPPGADRLRAELLHARVLVALERPDEAIHELTRCADKFPGRPEVPAAVADVEMTRGAYDRAEAAAERAIRAAPRDPAMKELLARARLGRGRYRELLRETEGATTRPLHLLRAQARIELSEWDRARQELEGTRRDGRMPAEAAAWLALCEVVSGRRSQAAAILQALEASAHPPAVAGVARARLLAAENKLPEAERRLRAAVATPGAPVLATLELAQVLRARQRSGEAAELLEPVVARNPFHAGARLALAQARLETGNASAAASGAERVLEDRPRDAEAARLLAQARLALGDQVAARGAAERAVSSAPGDPASWLLAGKVAAAQGKVATARRELAQAARLAGKSRLGEQARAELSRLPKR
ncbi:MAG: tetratricopeptide repeat protein [Deltaproteobacteria bacterium]|nr:tetratricopeptide repeat protein [Deltaproteobacteria bacterium]